MQPNLAYSVLITLCCLVFVPTGVFADGVGVYSTKECVPGDSDEARWNIVSSMMPQLLGKSKSEIKRMFGEPSHKWSQRSVSPETFEYCISQRKIDSGIFECDVMNIQFFENAASAVVISPEL